MRFLRRCTTPTVRAAAVQALEPRQLLASTVAYDFTPGTVGSQPYDFVSLGNDAYFFTRTTANAGLSVPVLWKTDGTDAGTTMVRAFSSNGVPGQLSAVAGRLFFYGAEPGQAVGPWVSDGTPEGTHRLKEGFTGPVGLGTQGFVADDDLVLFNGNVSSSERTWVTDGTAEGTRPLPGLNPIAGTEVRNLAVSGGQFYVTARTAAGGIGLFTADGTDGGTRLVRDFGNDGTTFLPRIGSMTDVGGTLYFTAPAAPNAGVGLWKTDGTPGGTVLVKAPGAGADTPPTSLVNVGGTLYFSDDGPTPGEGALWRSDGSAAGTVMVLDRAPGSDTPLQPAGIVDASGFALFAGTDSAHGTELWRSDGTAAGTYPVADVRPGPESGLTFATDFHVAQGQVFFAASSPPGSELWVTDGTGQGTRRAADLNPAGTDYVSAGGTTLGGRLVFSAGSPDPWVSDGTQGGTHRLASVLPTPRSTTFHPQIPVPVGRDRLLVNLNSTVYAVDAANNAVPVLTNVWLAGGSQGDLQIARQPGWAALDDGVVVFAAHPAVATTRSLYRSDGTPEGTYKVGALNLRGFDSHMGAPDLVRFGDHVYFTAVGSSPAGRFRPELWRTDGTREGTTLVMDMGAPVSQWPDLSLQPLMAVADDRLYFQARPDGAASQQLWQTDGTGAGTRPVADFPGRFGEFAGVGDRLFFSGRLGSGPSLLWTSDGTAEGTAPVSNAITVPLAGSVVPFGDHVYFIGSQAGGVQNALFRSDGTEAGTVAVSPPDVGAISDWATTRGRLYLVVRDALWTTDGTSEGTVRLPVPPHQPWPMLASLAAAGDHLYFRALHPDYGAELWRSDGTAAGTTVAEDVYPGITSSFPQGLTTVGDTLYFIATDPVNGTELRRLDVGRRGAVVARHVFYNGSAFDGDDPAAGAADDCAIAPDKVALLAGEPASFAHVTSYVRGLNGIMVDLPGLRGDLTGDDFVFRVGAGDGNWADAPGPLSVTRRAGAGVGGSDRVTLVWQDGAVVDRWLQVTVLANGRTGLAAADVFSFGNLSGESGDGSGGLRVNASDVAAVKRNLSTSAVPINSPCDFNRDGRVNALDVAAVKRSLTRTIAMPPLTTGVGGAGAVGRVVEGLGLVSE